jgi:O-antigen/teichoic acid export membrane protein
MQIDKKDVLWNYGATFLKIASSAVLLPFILRMMSSEMVGIWSIFMTITILTTLLDFGFSSAFTRNVTYVFSGVTNLKINGHESVSKDNRAIDYALLKGVISSMRWFYLLMAGILFLLLSTIGTYYIYSILQVYEGDPQEVLIAWVLLCLISTYNLLTNYYDALLLGKGLIKKSKQIIIIGQTVYLFIAAILIMAGYGLVAIVSAQASSVIIIRLLSYNSFFTKDLKHKLFNTKSRPRKEVLKAVYPNAIKIGITSLGSFLVQRSAIILGVFFLPLEKIGSFGITMQLIAVIVSLAGIYTATYQPKIAQLRIRNNNVAIKEIYLKGQIFLFVTFFIGGLGLLIFGPWAIHFIGSQTELIPTNLILIALIVSLLESNHAIAGGILLTKNEVPFFKAAIFSGVLSIILLLFFLKLTNFGLWAMIAAPGIAQGVYQNWKWPIEVIKELEINKKDMHKTIIGIKMKIINKLKLINS